MADINRPVFFKEYLKIVTKQNGLQPFIMNEPQMRLERIIREQEKQNKPVRIIILKARQMGFSTFVQGYAFTKTIFNRNYKAGIITQDDTATNNLFDMSKTFYNNLPDFRPQLKASNAKALIFDDKDGKGLGSSIKCMTAGSSGVGRSGTFHFLHLSELPHWRETETLKKSTVLTGLLQAVPSTPNSVIIIESTACGFDLFRDMWNDAVSGKSEYVPLFVGWHELKTYVMPYHGFPLTELEESMKAKFNLSNEQLAWRRHCIANNLLFEEEAFRQEYPSYPEEAFLVSGTCVFDKEIVIKRLNEIEKPKKCGYFKYRVEGQEIIDISFIEDKNGCINIYEEPREHYPYVIGGDTAGDGSDNFTGVVINNVTGNQVAVLKMETDEDLYALQMYCLGTYFNTALISIETNFSTFPVKEIQRFDYPNIYIRKNEDSYVEKYSKSFGFRTTQKTRPIIIAELIKIFREDPESIVDRETLNEFLTFVRNSAGRAQAMVGKHDDLVMATAIAYFSRDQQSFTIEEKHMPTQTVGDYMTEFTHQVYSDEEDEGRYIVW